jgi:hypothetical protein
VLALRNALREQSGFGGISTSDPLAKTWVGSCRRNGGGLLTEAGHNS